MQELRVVAVSPDGESLHLVLDGPAGPDPVETFRLPLDDGLRSAVRAGVRSGKADHAPALSPREIQTRLRAGAALADVARAAGVEVERIEQLAAPVLQERALTVVEVQRLVQVSAQDGASVLPIGAAVAHHLARTSGLHAESVEWSAQREDGGAWTVTLRYVVRGRVRVARWQWRRGAREATCLDEAAATLGFVTRRQLQRRVARPGGPPTATAVLVAPAADAAPAQAGPAEQPVGADATTQLPPPTGADRPLGASRPAARRRRQDRASSLPSWQDVLLGPPADRNDRAAASPRLDGQVGGEPERHHGWPEAGVTSSGRDRRRPT